MYRSKVDNFAAILEAEPQATWLAISNIILLSAGFGLSLVKVACGTLNCHLVGNIGQVIVAFAALLLAGVELYMQFFVSNAAPAG